MRLGLVQEDREFSLRDGLQDLAGRGESRAFINLSVSCPAYVFLRRTICLCLRVECVIHSGSEALLKVFDIVAELIQFLRKFDLHLFFLFVFLQLLQNADLLLVGRLTAGEGCAARHFCGLHALLEHLGWDVVWILRFDEVDPANHLVRVDWGRCSLCLHCQRLLV